MSENNERLHELLVKQIEKFDGAVDESVEFAMEHAPDLVQQLLLWHSLKSIMISLLGVIVGTVGIAAFRHYLKEERKVKNRENEKETKIAEVNVAICFWIMVIMLVVGISIVCVNSEWLKIWVAPKLYLFEYAAGLVK